MFPKVELLEETKELREEKKKKRKRVNHIEIHHSWVRPR
jgi:hypothetical protein